MNLSPELWLLLCTSSAVLGGLLVWLWLRGRFQAERHQFQLAQTALQEHLNAARQRQQDGEAARLAAEDKLAHWQQRCHGEQSRAAAAAEAARQWQERAAQSEGSRQAEAQDYAVLQQELADLRLRHERLCTQIEQERLAQEEKLALLGEARQSLSSQFQHLANEILEEKSRRFSEQNREQIGLLLNPLNERISGFSQLVQNTYEKEAKERLTLENELKRLQQLNHQLHDDAQALTRALVGSRNKSQGNWGEMILEKVLESSGLVKGREYSVQSGGRHTDEDGRSRYLQPDVLVHLPENKQIIIDAKVSLTAYVRYTGAQTAEEAETALAAHLASVRQHVKTLSAKSYSGIEGLTSLDFVFMFVPVEPAYLLALQHDPELFQECFDKRIMLTGPGTLLATLRTVANLWRNEYQNQNALKIAEEGGRLYDKFVGFVSTLEGVGKNLEQAQSYYQQAFKQLSEGRGNLVNRAQKLYRLGVKTNKQLERGLAEQAEVEAETLPGLPEQDQPTEEAPDKANSTADKA
ncbi:MAG: DNA recombination protein RmuC [Eikenella sp.]|nr:DNA recombination protein RmuC [Eikenella sp.]